MILVDFSQLCISNIMQNHAAIGSNRSDRENHIEADMVRHMILNSLRMYITKFKGEYGDPIVLCLDSKNNWRKEIFPYYKAHRAKDRKKSIVDWSVVFNIIDALREEFKHNMPYKVLQIDHAEADDIIGAICHKFGSKFVVPATAPKILIISGDKDFQQLQEYANVQQYSPVQKKHIVCTNPELFLKEHICKGDSADGIPNFLSPDHTFISKQARQHPLRTKRLDEFLANEVFLSSDEQINYQRNKKMIDLKEIPLNIQEQVIDTLIKTVPADRSKMLNYFVDKRLKSLIGALGEF